MLQFFIAILFCIHGAVSLCPCQLQVVVTYSTDNGVPLDVAAIATDIPTLLTGFETLVISEDSPVTTVHTAHTQHAMGMGMGMGSAHVPTVHVPSAHTQHTAHAPMVGTVHAAMTSHASMSLSMGIAGTKAETKAVQAHVTTIYLSTILPTCGAGDVQAFTDAATAVIQSYFDEQGTIISVIADAATTSTCDNVLSAIAAACYDPVPVGSALVEACHNVNEALLCNLAKPDERKTLGNKDTCASDFTVLQTQLSFVVANCYFDEVDTETEPPPLPSPSPSPFVPPPPSLSASPFVPPPPSLSASPFVPPPPSPSPCFQFNDQSADDKGLPCGCITFKGDGINDTGVGCGSQ